MKYENCLKKTNKNILFVKKRHLKKKKNYNKPLQIKIPNKKIHQSTMTGENKKQKTYLKKEK